MEQTLEGMRTLAVNMVSDEGPVPKHQEDKQPSHPQETDEAAEPRRDPEAGPSAQTGKPIIVNDSESEEADTTQTSGGEASGPEGEEELEATYPISRTLKTWPKYKSTPLSRKLLRTEGPKDSSR